MALTILLKKGQGIWIKVYQQIIIFFWENLIELTHGRQHSCDSNSSIN